MASRVISFSYMFISSPTLNAAASLRYPSMKLRLPGSSITVGFDINSVQICRNFGGIYLLISCLTISKLEGKLIEGKVREGFPVVLRPGAPFPLQLLFLSKAFRRIWRSSAKMKEARISNFKKKAKSRDRPQSKEVSTILIHLIRIHITRIALLFHIRDILPPSGDLVTE